MIADFMSMSGNNGQSPLLNVTKVSNGWIVVIHHHNRDKEISQETLAKREEEEKNRLEAQKEREKQRIIRDMKVQLANMAMIGEAAGKAQHKGLEDSIEPWKSDEDAEEVEDKKANYDEKIETLAAKIADETYSGPTPHFGGFPLAFNQPTVETMLFTDRQKMIEFVTSMLHPLIE